MPSDMSPKTFALEHCYAKDEGGKAQESIPNDLICDSNDGEKFVNNNDLSNHCVDDKYSILFNNSESTRHEHGLTRIICRRSLPQYIAIYNSPTSPRLSCRT